MRNRSSSVFAVLIANALLTVGCVPHVCDHSGCEILRKQDSAEAYMRGKIEGDGIGFDRGYGEGHAVGHRSGYQSGEQRGLFIGDLRGQRKGHLRGYVEGAFSSFIEMLPVTIGTALAILLAIPVLGIPIIMLARPIKRFVKRREAEFEAKREREEAVSRIEERYAEQYEAARIRTLRKVMALKATANERFCADFVQAEYERVKHKFYHNLLALEVAAISKGADMRCVVLDEIDRSVLPPNIKASLYKTS